MNKKVNIEKIIDFSKSISDITAISLEHDLKFVNGENIEGNLIVSGKYKTTLVAEKEETFNYKIPIEITLTESLDVNTTNIDITDFVYDIVDDKSLLCKIELVINGSVMEENRECDGDILGEKEIPKIDDNKKESEILEVDNFEEEVTRDEEETVEEKELFNIDNGKETFGTFIVYIVRQNESINSIISKYNTSLEEIEKYNDIKDLSIGSKLIIPLLKNESK